MFYTFLILTFTAFMSTAPLFATPTDDSANDMFNIDLDSALADLDHIPDDGLTWEQIESPQEPMKMIIRSKIQAKLSTKPRTSFLYQACEKQLLHKKIVLSPEDIQKITPKTGLNKKQIYKWAFDHKTSKFRKPYLAYLTKITDIDQELLDLRTQTFAPVSLFYALAQHLLDINKTLSDAESLVLAIRYKLSTQQIHDWLKQKRACTPLHHIFDLQEKYQPIPQDLNVERLAQLYKEDKTRITSTDVHQSLANICGVPLSEIQYWHQKFVIQNNKRKANVL